MVVFDTTTLLLALIPGSKPPTDPNTGQPITFCETRVKHLIEKLNNSGNVILVPTPVLTELLGGAGAAQDALMKAFHKGNRFRVADFDQRAALELAIMLGDWYDAKKPRDRNETAAKLKFDRQIVAIAKANNADTIYSDDQGLQKFAEKNGLKVVLTWDIPLPPAPPIRAAPRCEEGSQTSLFTNPIPPEP